jgi:hypothetical protein
MIERCKGSLGCPITSPSIMSFDDHEEWCWIEWRRERVERERMRVGMKKEHDHVMTLDEYVDSKTRFACNDKLLMKQWNGSELVY